MAMVRQVDSSDVTTQSSNTMHNNTISDIDYDCDPHNIPPRNFMPESECGTLQPTTEPPATRQNDHPASAESANGRHVDEPFYLYNVNKTAPNRKWHENIRLLGTTLSFMVDSGAGCNVIPLTSFNRLPNRPPLEKCDRTLQAYGGTRLEVVGKFATQVTRNVVNDSCDVIDGVCDEFIVCREVGAPIMGLDLAERLRFITRVNNLVLSKDDDVFHGLGKIRGSEYDIELKSGVSPVKCATRRVPQPLQAKLKAELKRMVGMGVITPVKEATDWQSALVTVVKKSGDLRVCIDPTALNKSIKRRNFVIPTAEQLFAKMKGASVFSVIDASSGFWQIPLSERSSYLTTFSTPFGRFRFLRLPFGISSAPEYFHQTVSDGIDDLEGCDNYIDDIIVYADSIEEHNRRLAAVLERCREMNLKLNYDKCRFGVSEVTYLGHKITAQGLLPDPEKVEAISKIPVPGDAPAVRRLLATVQYCAKFIPNLSAITKPLRDLVKAENEFVWSAECAVSFEKIKAVLTSSPVLALYDPKLPVTIVNDASSYGFGSVLLQGLTEDTLRPVCFASRAMTSAEVRYSQIEKELMAIAFGLTKYRDYAIGATVNVYTDHKPLVPIFEKEIWQTPLRVQRILHRIKPYSFTLTFAPGCSKILAIADCLSRAPVGAPDGSWSDNVQEHVVASIEALPVSQPRLDEIRRHLAANPDMVRLASYIQNGFPESKDEIPASLGPFWCERADLSVANGLLMKGSRLFIPPELRRRVLSLAHDSTHLGQVKTKELLRQSMFWPGMNAEIVDKIAKCDVCVKHRVQHPEPLLPTRVNAKSRPWKMIHTDLFSFNGRDWLVVVDTYSHYLEVARLSDATSTVVVSAMKAIFSTHGVPEIVVSDNGPCYDSAVFRKFADDWNFRHYTTSPHHPQANGSAERAVKTVKEWLVKGADLSLALLQYRSSPHEAIGVSPNEVLFGRRTRGVIPIHESLLYPKAADRGSILLQHKQYVDAMKSGYDSRHRAASLDRLVNGDFVYVRDKLRIGKIAFEGKVVGQEGLGDRSYWIRVANGNIIRRNRSALIKRAFTDVDVPDRTPSELPVPIAPEPQQQPLRRSERTNAGVPPQRYQAGT